MAWSPTPARNPSGVSPVKSNTRAARRSSCKSQISASNATISGLSAFVSSAFIIYIQWERQSARQSYLVKADRWQKEFSLSRLTRSEEHTSELQSLMRISYAVFCVNKKKKQVTNDSRASSSTL